MADEVQMRRSVLAECARHARERVYIHAEAQNARSLGQALEEDFDIRNRQIRNNQNTPMRSWRRRDGRIGGRFMVKNRDFQREILGLSMIGGICITINLTNGIRLCRLRHIYRHFCPPA